MSHGKLVSGTIKVSTVIGLGLRHEKNDQPIISQLFVKSVNY